MVELKAENYKDSCELVQRLMADSSAEVLNGFKLKAAMDFEAFPSNDLPNEFDEEY
jgi:hypothetical protein